ncbi:radical SAM family heme chaperone HemW [Luteolibacter sp. AS25]|uniref:radical SAM family heme chaperone HemW n=1 Tax=Luteolibacter sp. AS25 TaxID=3135776 RepID=UPI00398AE08D
MLLYLHIPFCHRICPYCSFYKHTPGSTPIGKFVGALGEEALQRKGNLPLSSNPTSIYLGGGTPSMLSSKHLSALFASLHNAFDITEATEITLEANPATFDLKKARHFKSLGVTRVSLGIQSFTSHVLETLGREHSPEQASDSVKLLREAGIPSINIDLMFSIPGQSLADWEATLHTAISLKPDHISAYNLTYEEDTAFFDSLKNGTYSENEDHDADHYHLAEKLLTSAGFDHYETSNYAQPGHHSRHNQGYWQGSDYLGLGPSAVSTIGNIRQKNIPDTAAYIKQVNAIGNAIHETEELTSAQRRIELIALGLRTTKGIPIDLLVPESLERARVLASENLLRIGDTRLHLTALGRPLVDPIAAELI